MHTSNITKSSSGHENNRMRLLSDHCFSYQDFELNRHKLWKHIQLRLSLSGLLNSIISNMPKKDL